MNVVAHGVMCYNWYKINCSSVDVALIVSCTEKVSCVMTMVDYNNVLFFKVFLTNPALRIIVIVWYSSLELSVFSFS